VPDPGAFFGLPPDRRLGDWLQAALKAWRLGPERASVEAGLGEATMRAIMDGRYTPERPTLDTIAGYFGVDQAALRALRPRIAGYVAMGKKRAEEMGAERMAAIRALSPRGVRALPAEERRRRAKIGGIVSAAKHGRDGLRAMSAKAAAVRRSNRLGRGNDFFVSPASRAHFVEHARKAGRRGIKARVAGHGAESVIGPLLAAFRMRVATDGIGSVVRPLAVGRDLAWIRRKVHT
jgi:hypothetical protein